MTKKELNDLGFELIGCAIEVHKQLGPGLLESVYEFCYAPELQHRGLAFKKQLVVPVTYRGQTVDTTLRLDFLVQEILVVELKAVEKLSPVFEAQVLSYMNLTQAPKGLLINFNCDNISRNVRQFVNKHYNLLPE